MRRGLLPGIIALAAAAAGCGGTDRDSASRATAPAWAYEKEFGPGPVRLVLRVDRTEVSLADTVTVEEELRIEDGFEADLPEYLPEDFEGFTVTDVVAPRGPGEVPGGATLRSANAVEKAAAPAVSPAAAPRRLRLSLVPERSGDLAIAPLAVYFRKSGEETEEHFLTEEIPVRVKGIDDPAELVLRDARGIRESPPEPSGRGPLLLALAGGAALSLAAVAWVVLRRRPIRLAPPVPPHELAYEALRRLVALGLVEKGEVELFFVHLSRILRDYIENRFEVHAPELTTQEFLEEAARQPSLDAHRKHLGEFLELSDRVKFAQFLPETDAIQGAFDAVKRFLEETTPREA
jgi:hypothetical protein